MGQQRINPQPHPSSGCTSRPKRPIMAKMNCTKSVRMTAAIAECTVQQGDGAGDKQGQPTGPDQQNAAQFDGGERTVPITSTLKTSPKYNAGTRATPPGLPP